MPKIESEVDKLLIYDPDKARSTTHIFISRPTPLEEKSLGKLFIICEIDTGEKINHEIINIIQEEIKNNYYYSDETNVETAFENALSKVNQSLHHLISEGVTSWLDHFNIIISVIKGTEVYISHLGRIHAFLIHANKIVDILEQDSSHQQKINPLKIFSNIVEGNVNPDDQILFCTTSILDYFSQEKLRRTISNSLPSDSVKELEKILLEAHPNTAFAAIITKLIPQEEILPEQRQYKESAQIRPQSSPPPETSMEELINQEKRTSEYLAPSVVPNFTKVLKNGFSSLNNLIKTKVLKKEPKRTLPEAPYYTPRKQGKSGTLKIIFISIGKAISVLLAGLASIVLFIFNLFKKRPNIKNKFKDFPHKTEEKIHGGIFRFRRMSKKARQTLIIAAVLLFIFTTSVVWIGWRRENMLTEERKQEIIEEIKDLTFEAGAALSYEDERGAKQLLNQARDLLAELPNRSKDDKAVVSGLEVGISEQHEKTRHVVNIENPVLKKDFSSLEGYSPPQAVIQSSDFAYLYNANNNIYEIDLTNNEVTEIKNNLTDIGQFKLMTKETNTTALLYHDKKGIIELDLNNGVLTPLSIEFARDNINISDMTVYRSRFYYLDVQNNQIFRHQRGAVGFGPSTEWISDPNLNVQNGTSLVVDGSIYLLRGNGQLLELFQGYEQDFSLDEIDPTMVSAQKVWTEESSDYLWVLDNQNKRLVQFDKKGNLKNQYYSDKFNDLKDFAIDKGAEKAFILAGSNLFEITIIL